ncbi:unnamed protein product [Acanthoscelides obtectus]|uniref:small monomeric GTPase n=1 Tax=Acanthoscelides obtectus TaxID=200917 RepID=A0A9P0NW26_ACAOB|nr:unnamed protein product [Acanthoscelides obtectus]CAK1679193.1 Ras-related and estrogen-regulated growth inhibitor-like protein [Acanthoscelides obtectus]
MGFVRDSLFCGGQTKFPRSSGHFGPVSQIEVAFILYQQVCVDEGQEVSLQFGCQFYEVSAAENFAGVSLAFQSMLREARSVQLLKALPIRRKLGVNSVSKVLGNIFGNRSKADRKKRPSLSI